jgi:hypothetical protein
MVSVHGKELELAGSVERMDRRPGRDGLCCGGVRVRRDIVDIPHYLGVDRGACNSVAAEPIPGEGGRRAEDRRPPVR